MSTTHFERIFCQREIQKFNRTTFTVISQEFFFSYYCTNDFLQIVYAYMQNGNTIEGNSYHHSQKPHNGNARHDDRQFEEWVFLHFIFY